MRGDEDALRAKNEVLERELADARAALADARAPKPPPVQKTPTWKLPAFVTRALAWLAPPAPTNWRWPRYLGLGTWAGGLAGGTLLATTITFTYGDAYGGPIADAAFWVVVAWTFLGPGLLIWLMARALAAPSARAAGVIGGLVTFVLSLSPGAHPILRDAASIGLLGTQRGTLDQIAATPVLGWAHFEPAWIGPAVGEGVSVSEHTDSSGRTTTSSSRAACAPLVPSPGFLGPVSFVVCEDERAALPIATGALEGRVMRAYTPNDRAIEALRSQGVAVSADARVVTPTGPLEMTMGIGLAAFALLLLLGSGLSAFAAVRAAVERD